MAGGGWGVAGEDRLWIQGSRDGMEVRLCVLFYIDWVQL